MKLYKVKRAHDTSMIDLFTGGWYVETDDGILTEHDYEEALNRAALSGDYELEDAIEDTMEQIEEMFDDPSLEDEEIEWVDIEQLGEE